MRGSGKGLTTLLIALAVAASACGVQRPAGKEGGHAPEPSNWQMEDVSASPADSSAFDLPAAASPSGALSARSSAGSSKPAAGGGSVTSVTRRASDRGVSPNEIALGLVASKSDSLAQFGWSPDYENTQEAMVRPFVEEINASGGIDGRKLVVKVSEYNATSEDEMQAACVEQAEDFKVFASLAVWSFGYMGEACMGEKQVPLLTGDPGLGYDISGKPKTWVRRTTINKERAVRNFADWLVSTKRVKGSDRIGVTYTDVPEDRKMVYEVFVPYLKQKGLNVVEVAGSSVGTYESGSTEAQAMTLKFKANNVQVVLPVASFLHNYLFLVQADAIAYKPKYFVTDIGSLTLDVVDFYPLSQWQGVEGFTVWRTGDHPLTDLPNTPAYKECLRVYQSRGGKFDPDPNDSTRPEWTQVWNVGSLCGLLHQFAEAVHRAGVNPTRKGFLAAIDSLRAWNDRVAVTEKLTFTPSKLDGADMFAVIRFSPACGSGNSVGCYKQVEGFRKGTW